MSGHVVVSGGSGLIGRALTASLRSDGVRVVQLVRRTPRTPDEVEWLTGDTRLDSDALAGAKAVVNLNGANIGRLPWTYRYRRRLLSSRVEPTRELARAITELGTDAPAFLSASATGYYGHRPGETLTESDARGDTFLAKLCHAWEREARAAEGTTRVALLRSASVLHPKGVLGPLILLTRLGVGGPLGGGDQVWPWISLLDEVRAIRHVIDTDLSGPVNLCGPTPASANEIGRAVAHALRRPFWLPVPRWALRLGLGRGAADSLLLPDASATPAKLLASGFEFGHATAEGAVAAVLG